MRKNIIGVIKEIPGLGKRYWRELTVLSMFLLLQYQISEVNDLIVRVGKVTVGAAEYAKDAYYAADEATSAAQEAADNSSYCYWD